MMITRTGTTVTVEWVETVTQEQTYELDELAARLDELGLERADWYDAETGGIDTNELQHVSQLDEILADEDLNGPYLVGLTREVTSVSVEHPKDPA